MNPDYIFVYGTLRRSTAGLHPYLARDAEYIADGSVQGRLYEINDYPGAVATGDVNERIHGEVYKVRAMQELLERLDAYEECNAGFPTPHEYVRKVLEVRLSSGDCITAWVYVFNHDVTGLRHLTSGNYCEAAID